MDSESSILLKLQNLPLMKKKKPKKPIFINLKMTKYSIVKQITLETLQWKSVLSEDWDITWSDFYISDDFIRKLSSHQKINHFPGSYLLCKKNFLASHLLKLQQFFPEAYDFFPKTWILPFGFNNLQDYAEANHYKNVFIAKPEASCQGRGIFLTKKVHKTLNERENYVVQEYIKEPYLIDGYKFDLRLYVLIKNVEPLKIFLYQDGLVRFATEKFQKPRKKNFMNMFMHLTNYSINKKNPNFQQNFIENEEENGHKRSYLSIIRKLEKEGKNTKLLINSIDELIIKTICTVQPYLAHIYKTNRPKEQDQEMCFEILGFDILIDQNLKPLLLEVNHTPSFSTDSDLDFRIKSSLIRETLKLVNIRRKESKLKKNRDIFEYEEKHLGNFRRIYPNSSGILYENYMNSAKEIWDEWSQGKNKARRKSSRNEIPVQKLENKPIRRPFSAIQKLFNPVYIHSVQPNTQFSNQNNQICPIPSQSNLRAIKLIRPKSAFNRFEENKKEIENEELNVHANKNLKIVKDFLKPRNVGIMQDFNFGENVGKNIEMKPSKNFHYNVGISAHEFDDKKLQKMKQFPSELVLSSITKNSQKLSLVSIKQISNNFFNKDLKKIKEKFL